MTLARFDVVRRDKAGRELTRVVILPRSIPEGMSGEAWAREIARAYSATLHKLAGEDAGAWHAEARTGARREA